MQAQNTEKLATIEDVPVVDIQGWLESQNHDSEEMMELCKKVTDSLHKFGILFIKDPRAVEQDNDEYIDLMESYFDS